MSVALVTPVAAQQPVVAAPASTPRLNRRLGVAAIVVSATAMGAAGLFGRLATPPGQAMGEALTLGRMLVGALGMLALIAATGRLDSLRRTRLSWPVVLGGLLLGVSLATYLSATLLVDLALAVALHYTGPLVSVALAGLVLRERPSTLDALALTGSLAGMTLVAQPLGGGLTGVSPLGVTLGLVSGLTYGGALLCYRFRPDVPSDVRSLWTFSFGAVAVGALVALHPPDLTAMTPARWLWALAFFVVCGLLALGLLVVAGKHLRPAELSALSYVEVVVAAIAGAVAFAEPLGAAAAAGAALIAVAAVLPLARHRRH